MHCFDPFDTPDRLLSWSWSRRVCGRPRLDFGTLSVLWLQSCLQSTDLHPLSSQSTWCSLKKWKSASWSALEHRRWRFWVLQVHWCSNFHICHLWRLLSQWLPFSTMVVTWFGCGPCAWAGCSAETQLSEQHSCLPPSRCSKLFGSLIRGSPLLADLRGKHEIKQVGSSSLHTAKNV